jgi:hypothetical protein
MAGDPSFCDLNAVAEHCELAIETVQEYFNNGWFDISEEDLQLVAKGDSIYRCGLIDHLRRGWGYTDEEVTGVIFFMDEFKIARMGGGRVKERYVPFEQELAKNGPVWICIGLGEHTPERPIPFMVHGDLESLPDLTYRVVRSDAVLLQKGEIEVFELLGRKYGRGAVQPGLLDGDYRIHLGGCASYLFLICNDAKENFIELGLRYFQGTRCGEETEFHPACHLDDAIRDDSGEYYPLVGGWHDAGDFCHITSTTSAGMYLSKALEASSVSNRFYDELYNEAMHGGSYNLRARDQKTGKVFENKGVGRGGFTGKFGDNHRLTDNIINSGDERHIRTEAAVQTAMDCITDLAVMAREYTGPSELKDSCIAGGDKSWKFHEDQEVSNVYQYAKQVYAALEWYKTTGEDKWIERMKNPFEALCDCGDSDGDFVDLNGKILLEHYQHGSPLLALALAAEVDTPYKEKALEMGGRAADRMVELSKLQPYGITCYALCKDEHIDSYVNQDTVNKWHPLSNGKHYRMYQPFTGRFWQGSVSQLSVLGIGLAILGKTANRQEYTDLAWSHYDWCTGRNPYQCCMMSGWAENEAAPQSGVVGYMPGGTYQGPIGDQDDEPYFQVGFGMRIGEEPMFNYGGPSYAREYWSPTSGALVWLRTLLQ